MRGIFGISPAWGVTAVVRSVVPEELLREQRFARVPWTNILVLPYVDALVHEHVVPCLLVGVLHVDRVTEREGSIGVHEDACVSDDNADIEQVHRVSKDQPEVAKLRLCQSALSWL